MTDTYIDEIAVERAMHGDPVKLTKLERARVVRLLTERGLSAERIAERLHCTPRTVVRWRGRPEGAPRPVAFSRYRAYNWPHTEEWPDDNARHVGEVLVALCRLLDAGSDSLCSSDATLRMPRTGWQDHGPVVALEEAETILRGELERLMREHRPKPTRRANAPFFDVDGEPDWAREAVEALNERMAALLDQQQPEAHLV